MSGTFLTLLVAVSNGKQVTNGHSDERRKIAPIKTLGQVLEPAASQLHITCSPADSLRRCIFCSSQVGEGVLDIVGLSQFDAFETSYAVGS